MRTERCGGCPGQRERMLMLVKLCGLPQFPHCKEKRVADVHTLAQIMNWGQKCKKAGCTHIPNRQISQNGTKARMVLLNGNKEIGQRPTLAGGGLTIWSFRCGQVLYVETQLKQTAKLKSQSTACQLQIQASRWHFATLWGKSSIRKSLKIHFKNFCRIVTGSRQRRWPTPFGASRSCQQEPLAGSGYAEGCVESFLCRIH